MLVGSVWRSWSLLCRVFFVHIVDKRPLDGASFSFCARQVSFVALKCVLLTTFTCAGAGLVGGLYSQCTVLGSDRRSDSDRRSIIPNPNPSRSEANNFSFSSLLRSPIWTHNYPFPVYGGVLVTDGSRYLCKKPACRACFVPQVFSCRTSANSLSMCQKYL